MGAWGYGIFENDTAADWLGSFREEPDLATIEAALDNAISAGPDYLDATEAEEALAAAELVACLLGNASDDTADIDELVAAIEETPSPKLVQKARKAVARVMTEPSELVELWTEADSLDEWTATLEDLDERLEV
jgi:hypothetical protein